MRMMPVIKLQASMGRDDFDKNDMILFIIIFMAILVLGMFEYKAI